MASEANVKTESPLLELAERCERAAGPDRELDADIGNDQPPCRNLNPRDTRGRVLNHVPRYTASLDAATSLVPDGQAIVLAFNAARLSDAQVNWKHAGLGKSPALALCAAALRAIAAGSRQGRDAKQARCASKPERNRPTSIGDTA